MLCCVLVFGSAYRRPVKSEAAVTTVAVCGAALVATALIALGIGCSQALPTPEYNRTCQNIYNGMQTAVAGGAVALSMVGKDIYYHLSNDFLGSCLNGIRAAYPDHVAQIDGIASSEQIANLCGWNITNFGHSSNGIGGYQLKNVRLISKIAMAEGAIVSCGDVTYKISDVDFVHYAIPYARTITRIDTNSDFTLSILGYGTSLTALNDCTEFAQLQSEITVNGATQYEFWLICNNTPGSGICATPKTGTQTSAYLPDVYNPANKDLFADGYSVLNHKVDDVINKVGALQGIADGIRVKIGDVVGSIDQVTDQIRSKTQTQVTDVDASDDATEAENDKTNTGRDTTLPKNPSMPDMKVPPAITKKFPFSIPWDLYNAVTVLASPGEAPSWQTHIQNSTIGLDYTMKIDLSQFNALAAVMRWGLSLLFIIGLILVTTKLIKH